MRFAFTLSGLLISLLAFHEPVFAEELGTETLQPSIDVATDGPVEIAEEAAAKIGIEGEVPDGAEKLTDPDSDEPTMESAVAAMSSAPSDGSEDGERLAGLDSMGKVQSAAEYASSAGELLYQVPVQMPKYRGLEPKLGFVYNSQHTGVNGAMSLMGPGWNLKGFSSIERVSSRRGAPTYQSGKDIFLLDGMEMLKCSNGPVTIAGASTSYASSHVKSESSAGCSAGGHFTTLNETYFRIKFISSRNEFELTQKNGVKFIYKNVHALAPSATVAGDDYKNMRERRKWLLSRIEDTQENMGVVNFTYEFNTAGKSYYWQGYPERPHKIEYAGYVVEFRYIQQAQPVAHFTTGTRFVGKQFQLLEAVTIKHNSTKIRAYDLVYDTTPVTRKKLLSEIRPIGNNFSVRTDGTSAGSALPSHRFEYTEDGYTVQNRWYENHNAYVHPNKVHNGVHSSTGRHGADTAGETFHGHIRTVETNGDGIDEILALDVKPNGTGNPHYRERSGHFTFDINGNMTRNSAAYAIPSGRFTDGGSYWAFLGMNRWTPDQNRPMAIRGRFTNTGDKRYLEANPLTANWYNNLQVDSARATDRVHWLTGNFDGDPEIEVMIRDVIHDVNEVADTASERFPKKTLSNITHPRCTGRTWVNARVADVNGDGIDDVLFKATESGHSSQYCLRLVNENGYIDQHYSSERVITCCANVRNLFYWSFGFGDFNGDGILDSVRFGNVDGYDTPLSSVDQLDLKVATGHGDGTFSSRSTWFENVDMLGMSNNEYYANAVIATDLNGDGLDDVVVYAGFDDATYSWSKRKRPGPIRMFLSTGTGFVEQKMFSGGAIIRDFGTIGDFNGDGVKDLAFGDSTSKSRPRILFGSSEAGHRITKITTNLGETVDVTFKPSTHFPDDQTPYVRQLVHTVTTDPGIGGARTVTFGYKNGRFDYTARKPLGFQEVQVTLPLVGDETEELVQVTEYMTGHVAEIGLVKRQFIKYGSTIYKDTQNTWSVVKSGNGPYRSMKTRERVGARHGNRLIYRQKDFTYNQYNEVLTEIDRGFDGAQDDTSIGYRYNANTSAYIVNKVAIRATHKGTTPSTSKNNPDRLYAEYFQYDDRGLWEAPIRGNATLHRIWTGTIGKDTSRIVRRVTYNENGNPTEERNALNHPTTYTYTGPEGIFEATVSNAKGHLQTTTWNTACQKPATVTDPNGLVTSYTNDVHCRETMKRVAWGTKNATRQDFKTNYVSIGNATAQYIETSQKSSNTLSGQQTQYRRKYFDGAGNVYKETTSGATSSINTASVILRRLDARGRKIWESNPISWADAGNNDATEDQRTSFTYDPAGRVTQMTFANGAQRVTTYSNKRRTELTGQRTYFPQVNVWGEQCDDGNEATVCEESQQVVDADGNILWRFEPDRALTDVDTGTGIWRYTRYEYDHLSRLIQVIDPGGLTFTYKYDVYGNRVEQSDPGLGRWSMEYNADNSLKRQVDAKGQEIYFWYDALGRAVRKRVQLKSENGSHVSYTNTYMRYDGDESTKAAGNYYTGFLTKQWTDGPDAHVVENRYDRRGNVVWQNNTVRGKTYNWSAQYTISGQLSRQTYFYKPGQTSRTWTPAISYDTADRQVAFGGYITSTTYDLWGNMTERHYGNGARTRNYFDAARGWVTSMRHYDANNKNLAYAIYTKSVSGRVLKVNSINHQGDLEYTYDYAGRLLSAQYWGNKSNVSTQVDQTFAYDKAGRMRFNSRVGTYNYASTKTVGSNGNSFHGHAPGTITEVSPLVTQRFEYDANGNMTEGLHGKVMTYDGENRPQSVTYNGNTTKYVYGSDGSRLQRIEKAGTSEQEITVYLNGTEIRHFGEGSSVEEMVTHLADEVRISYGGALSARMDYLHYDQLGSVIGMSNAAGATAQRTAFLAFGTTSYDRQFDSTMLEENKGFVGERYDADAGLQFLNARYFDPELALFIQPDWFEVTEPGVGTNRYSYSFNDPVNLKDPNGNAIPLLGVALLAWNAFSTILDVFENVDRLTKIVVGISTGNPAMVGAAVLDFAIDLALDRIPFGSYLRNPLKNFLGRVGIDADWVGQKAVAALEGKKVNGALEASDFHKANTGLQANRIRGVEFENFVLNSIGTTKNTKTLKTSLANTIPDGMGRGVGGILEIKDVKTMRYTRQMRSQYLAAKDAGMPLNLILGPSNQTIHPRLMKAIESTGGSVIRYRPDLSGWDQVKF
ncbi:RHS repeat-associated core domain-containing protein [Parasedimentitalea huanghaiensis]|uniref:Tox-REase-7 domain-containing protein n=1 Tax=Parasedimentitalea huanghaiensis TaxID=2682100 RepID=A0A6L6WS34_9RHOB|nr:RHS repeat-associated core domain-containing protein [Zongyanglinia huanghaiensis]MVO18727.1 hypothetical protein [Zongyanglinia huanghaiensis]